MLRCLHCDAYWTISRGSTCKKDFISMFLRLLIIQYMVAKLHKSVPAPAVIDSNDIIMI